MRGFKEEFKAETVEMDVSLAALPGYVPSHSGQVRAMTQVLPWWRFARPKAAGRRAGTAQPPPA